MAVAAPKRAAAPSTWTTSFDADPYGSAIEQASHLRASAWTKLDVSHLADKIEDVAATERHRLSSSFRIILLYLLKWDHQPERRSRSWTVSIRNQRLAAEEQLEHSPSLVPQIGDLVKRAYRRARIEAAGETGLEDDAFPEVCPYDYETITTRPVPWPPAAEGS